MVNEQIVNELIAYSLKVLNLEFVFNVKILTICKLTCKITLLELSKNRIIAVLFVILLTFRLRCNFTTIICNGKIFWMFFLKKYTFYLIIEYFRIYLQCETHNYKI